LLLRSHTTPNATSRAAVWGLTTLVVTAIGIFILNTAIDGGAKAIGISATPLFDGFKAIFGDNAGAAILALIALGGLIASFFTIIYAYGRNTYSLSRAGYFPHFLSVTHPTLKTPHIALIAGGVVGLALACLITYLGTTGNLVAGQIVGALLYMAVFGAVISYAMQCASFIMLRRRLPNIERPYRSPLGEWGAGVAGVIAVISLISLYFNEAYRPGSGRNAHLLPCRHRLLRAGGPPPPCPIARGRVRADAGPARRPGERGLRPDQGHRHPGGRRRLGDRAVGRDALTRFDRP
jgi:ethanolamine permease